MNLFDFHDSRIHSGYWWLAKMVYYIRFDEKSQFIRKFLLNEIFSTKSFFWMPIKEIDTTTIYNLHNENGEPDQNAKYIFSGIWILNRPHFMIGNDSLLWYNTYNSIKRSKPSAECCWGYLLLLWLMGSVDKGWLNPSELFPLLLPSSSSFPVAMLEASKKMQQFTSSTTSIFLQRNAKMKMVKLVPCGQK